MKTEINEFGLPNIVIPAEILFHPELTQTEKILFGFINNLDCSPKGCWASNKYFGLLLNIAPQTASSSLAKLKKWKFIIMEYEELDNGSQVRRIFIDKTYPQRYSVMIENGLMETLMAVNKKRKKGVKKNLKGVKKNLTDDKEKSLRGFRKSLSKLDIELDKELDKNSLSEKNKKPKTTVKEKNKEYLSIAKRLSKIIQSKKNIKYTPSQINNWCPEIRKLSEQNGIDKKRMIQALKWYSKNIGNKYVPVIESGGSFREKFIKLENAIARDNEAPDKPVRKKLSNAHFGDPNKKYPC